MALRTACLAVIALILAPGCSSDQSAPSKTGTTPSGDTSASSGASSGAAKGSAGADPAAAFDVSAEMKDFISGIDGSEGPIDKALAKYVAEGVNTDDIKERAYSAPKIVKLEKKGDQDCYTLNLVGGVFTFTFELCWEGGKIVEIKQLQMIETRKLKQ
jgi:hypothetical protein